MAGSIPILTVGMEFETFAQTPTSVAKYLPKNIFSTVHDASIETDARLAQSNLIIRNGANNPLVVSNTIGNSNIVMGTEIVTIPLTDEYDIREILKQLTFSLMEMGEPDKSERCGVHFHICMYPNLKTLKSIVRLGRHLEDVFFYLGGQGYDFRGMTNNSIYCRPITKWGPPCIRTNRGYAQIFNVVDLLQSETSNEFWYRYGCSQAGSRDRYVPQRYTWLNLYSFILHGTLEFRVFNTTLNPAFLFAEIQLCLAFAKTAMSYSFDMLKNDGLLAEHSIFSQRTKKEILDTLHTFAETSGLETEYVNTLATIIKRTPQITIPKEHTLTHLPNATSIRGHWEGGDYVYAPTIIPDNEIVAPEWVDIHRLRGERNR